MHPFWFFGCQRNFGKKWEMRHFFIIKLCSPWYKKLHQKTTQHLWQKGQKMAMKKPRISPKPIIKNPPPQAANRPVTGLPWLSFKHPAQCFSCLWTNQNLHALMWSNVNFVVTNCCECSHPTSVWVFVAPQNPTVTLPQPSSNLKPHPQTFRHTGRVEVGSFLRKAQC